MALNQALKNAQFIQCQEVGSDGLCVVDTHITAFSWLPVLEYAGLSYACMLSSNSCLTLCGPMNYRPPGFSVHRISQARILEGYPIPFSGESSWPRDQTHIFSCIAGRLFTTDPLGKPWVKYEKKRKHSQNFLASPLPFSLTHLCCWRNVRTGFRLDMMWSSSGLALAGGPSRKSYDFSIVKL